MRLNIIILTVTILLGLGLTFWLDRSSLPASQNSPATAAESISGDTIPDFTFTDLSGSSHTSGDFRGKTVILNFWATWCAPCIIEFPKLVKLAAENKDIILIALSSDIGDENIHKFLKKYPAKGRNIIIARDNKRHITTDIFNTYKLPETIIISPSGKMVKKIVGDTDWNGQEIKDFLSSLE